MFAHISNKTEGECPPLGGALNARLTRGGKILYKVFSKRAARHQEHLIYSNGLNECGVANLPEAITSK